MPARPLSDEALHLIAAVRDALLDRLGDLVAEHADTDALWRLIESGAPPGLPLLPPGSSAG